jgi:hypothetical protein
MNIFKKLRDDNSIIIVKIKEPRVNAIFSSHLRKYVVSIAGAIYKGKLKKMLGFSNVAAFNIIVDVEEEVYKNVFIKEIVEARFCGDCCDLVDSGDCFSMFWRNQREKDRWLRIRFDDGTELEFTRKGYNVRTVEENNLKGSLKNGK